MGNGYVLEYMILPFFMQNIATFRKFFQGNLDAAEILLNKGADPTLGKNKIGHNILHIMALKCTSFSLTTYLSKMQKKVQYLLFYFNALHFRQLCLLASPTLYEVKMSLIYCLSESGQKLNSVHCTKLKSYILPSHSCYLPENH